MSGEPEANVEDILASIRKIIAEDDAREENGLPADKDASGGGADRPRPPLPGKKGGVLTLTRMVREDGSVEDLDEDDDAEGQAWASSYGLSSEETAEAVGLSFEELKQALDAKLKDQGDSARIEALAKPLIKEWLDANLPALVERVVREEVERLARRR